MKTLPCPDCGKTIRPCNMARHRRAQHLPKARVSAYGTSYEQPAKPIRLGSKKARRHDDVAPRGIGPYRYRIYRLRAGDLQLLVAVPNPSTMGRALVELHEKGAFEGDDSVGVLDTRDEPGHWVVSPFTLGRSLPS